MASLPTPPDDPLALFHPAVAAWFRRSFDAPTPAQRAAWPLIESRRATLVAAPTGSGKTLTAFLTAIDALVREGLDNGGALPDATLVVYVSPLKALSNDIRLNLERPLEGIAAELARLGLPPVEIRAAVRTGDTPQPERAALRRRAPHILVTTPESLYVLLGSESGRRMLSTTRTVIVDEIHAVAGNKRGVHLALSLERLDALCVDKPLRIGLSATQKPIETVARFLVGIGDDPAAPPLCEIVDAGHARKRDLALEVPPVPLEAIMANDVWERVYDRIAELVAMHRTTLVFVNTRRMAERVARHLTDRLGNEAVAAHHGSLAREHRFEAEQRLKRGDLRVLVATASLELGIDIGDVDLVVQIGSPRSIAAFLQRVGRSGHQVGGTPKGRLFPTSRDDLIECTALLDCVRRGELDRITLPHQPIDVLAQQIVAEVACQEWSEDALYALVRRSAPYAQLERARFDAVLRMLADGYTSRHGPRAAYLHRDVVSQTLRARRGARLVALTSGGTIPDNADYAVLLEPQSVQIGTVNEDFAVESLAGDVFQLGNASYRILRIEAGRVRVEDAQGQPPNIPFWLGEAPGRSDELSFAISRLRTQIEGKLAETPTSSDAESSASVEHATAWLCDALGLDDAAARQIVDYLARARQALTVLPTHDTLVMERFFDESGGTQLVIHSPYGSRMNRAWGLALRKRFCRQFNFELQAAATEDAIILSLTGAHSFALDEVWRYLHSNSAQHLLVQALLDAPLFGVRWRWNATAALALPRQSGGRKTPPQIQRMRSEDLLAAVFPDQVACVENLAGEREIPAHPLVDQTLDDCLHDAMDTETWLALLRRMEAGEVRLVTRELPAPSPLAAEILTARPYAFLDDAPIEERRTQAVLSRRWSDPESADDLGALDPDAIASVREEAWPQARNADEMHDVLNTLGALAHSEVQTPGWAGWLAELAASGRATRLPVADHEALWVGIERLACVRAIYPQAHCEPPLAVPDDLHADPRGEPWSEDSALVELIRARLSGFGPLSVAQVARPLALEASVVALALTRLEAEGAVMRGRFTPGAHDEEWCERHLLARIHRYTVRKLRREIEPVERHDFMRFLFEWQHVAPGSRGSGRDALAAMLDQLEGWEASALEWEDEILPARIDDYSPLLLDELCRSGRLTWARLPARAAASTTVRTTPVVLLPRRELARWAALLEAPEARPEARAQRVYDALLRHGAMFFDELAADAHLLGVELENALGELVAAGLVNADSFAGLRALVRPAAKRSAYHGKRRPRGFGPLVGSMADAGRWAVLRRVALPPEAPAEAPARVAQTRRLPADAELLEHVANVLLRRYGVIGWQLLAREAPWLPPWRDLLRVLHRMEARGHVRGGRFVTGLSGEQFALPEAIPLLREVRRRGSQAYEGEDDPALVCIAASDPLNLLGTVLPGEKVPAVAGNRIAFLDGLPVATLIAGRVEFRGDFDVTSQARLRTALIRSG